MHMSVDDAGQDGSTCRIDNNSFIWNSEISCPSGGNNAVAIDSDGLYPPDEQLEIAELAPLGELATLRSPHGHDAFLIETADLDRRIRSFRGRASAFRRRLAS